MATYYGSQFADKWKSVNIDVMKKDWSKKIAATLTQQQVLRGLETLEQCQYPPSLPDFIRLCKQAVPESHVAKISPPKLTQEEKEAGLSKLQAMKELLKKGTK
jgi:hypothetical protein